jgi:integrase
MPVIALSAKVIKTLACPPGKAKVDFHDAACKGLMLEIRESGGSTWYLRFSNLRGNQRQLRIADTRDLSLEQARKRADELRAKIALGQDPCEEKAALRLMPTFAEFVAERYMPFIKVDKKSWSADDSYLRNHLLPAFGTLPLDGITKHQVISFHHGMREKGYAPGTCNRCLVLLRYIFNLALEWEIPGVSKNPTRGVSLLRDDKKCERFLSRKEAQRLYKAIEKSENPQLKFIVPLLLMTGVRKRELFDAQWKDLDFRNRIWNIPFGKTGFRAVPLSDGTIAILNQIPRLPNNPYIVPNPETGKPYRSVFYSWNTARKAAGLPEVRMHDLRHSFASFLVNNGRTLYEVQRLLGHTQIRTTMKYAHLAQGTLLDAATAAMDALGAAFGPAASAVASSTLPQAA